MGLSRLSKKCSVCRFVSTCKHKQMEALAYLDEETMPISQAIMKESEMVSVTPMAIGVQAPVHNGILFEKDCLVKAINQTLHKDLFLPDCKPRYNHH